MVFLRGKAGSDADIAKMLDRASGFALPSAPPVPVERLIELSKRTHARMSFRNLSTILRRQAELFTESPPVSTRVG
jgi:hypothetical protein